LDPSSEFEIHDWFSSGPIALTAVKRDIVRAWGEAF
jgi:hypothetical protein